MNFPNPSFHHSKVSNFIHEYTHTHTHTHTHTGPKQYAFPTEGGKKNHDADVQVFIVVVYIIPKTEVGVDWCIEKNYPSYHSCQFHH